MSVSNILDRFNKKQFIPKKFHHDILDLPELTSVDGINGGPRLYTTPEGNKYPSVTSILSLLSDPNALKWWYKKIGYDEAMKQTQEAADRGNVLHDLSEKYLLNKLNEEDIGYDAGGMMFRNAQQYLDEIESVLSTECALYSDKYKYAGRTDAIVKHAGDICVLDHKNSKKLFTGTKLGYMKEKLFKYKLQTYFYHIALQEMTGIESTHGILVVSKPRLKPEEEYESEIVKWEFKKEEFHDLFEQTIKEYYDQYGKH